MNRPFVSAVIPAAGSSSRMKGVNKLKAVVGGMPVLARTLLAFQHSDVIDEIVVAAPEQDVADFAAMGKTYGITKLTAVVPGGRTRQQSVAAGVKACDPRAAAFAIHDGARPFVTDAVIAGAVADALRYGAAAAAVPVKDTVKISDGGVIAGTPDRSTLFACQTPQVFLKGPYLAALARAVQAGEDFTDDCQLLEAAGAQVRLSEGDYRNIKITTEEDLLTAAAFAGEGAGPMLRIGHGYDVHKLVPDRKLILGGVEIPYEKGLLGHSDADVLVHAVMDALLGAAGLDDIGTHFPDTDERFRGADSIALLRQVTALLAEKGFVPGNIDATVVAQRPKLRSYISAMRDRVAAACGLEAEQVNLKATTEEGLGFTGRGEGISATAVCTILKKA